MSSNNTRKKLSLHFQMNLILQHLIPHLSLRMKRMTEFMKNKGGERPKNFSISMTTDHRPQNLFMGAHQNLRSVLLHNQAFL